MNDPAFGNYEDWRYSRWIILLNSTLEMKIFMTLVFNCKSKVMSHGSLNLMEFLELVFGEKLLMNQPYKIWTISDRISCWFSSNNRVTPSMVSF
jgi:hypothetical protein